MKDTSERGRIIAARNRALGLLLLGFVVLFFAITIAKRSQTSAEATSAALVGPRR